MHAPLREVHAPIMELTSIIVKIQKITNPPTKKINVHSSLVTHALIITNAKMGPFVKNIGAKPL